MGHTEYKAKQPYHILKIKKLQIKFKNIKIAYILIIVYVTSSHSLKKIRRLMAYVNRLLRIFRYTRYFSNRLMEKS